MADAIRCGLPQVETTHTLIVWGDQVAIRRDSLEFLMRLQQGMARPAAVCPTLWRDRPYIHFEREASGRLIAHPAGARRRRNAGARRKRFRRFSFSYRNAPPISAALVGLRRMHGQANSRVEFSADISDAGQTDYRAHHDRSRVRGSEFARRRRLPGATTTIAFQGEKMITAPTPLKTPGWQAKAPAPLGPTWGRRFRLPTDFPASSASPFVGRRPMGTPSRSGLGNALLNRDPKGVGALFAPKAK